MLAPRSRTASLAVAACRRACGALVGTGATTALAPSDAASPTLRPGVGQDELGVGPALRRSPFRPSARGFASSSASTGTPQTRRPTFLITGAAGQIGVELTRELVAKYGPDAVVPTDARANESAGVAALDVTDARAVADATAASRPTHIIHLAAILSAAGEADPARALAVNCDGAAAVLAAAAAHGCAVFSPSTIAVYGSCAHPPSHTPDTAPQRPSTMYGVTKVFQECLGEYYAARWGVDYRSLRLPGVVSADAPPGGGTTDWACAIYEAALDGVPFTCALAPDTALPYAFMPDVLAGIQALMAAPASALTRRTYSVSSFSTTPAEVAASIQKILPAFKIAYAPDFRDGIARQWPASLDDTPARSDWGWAPAVAPDVAAMSAAMLERVAARRVREAQAAVVATAAEVKAAAKSAGAGGTGGGTPRLAVAAAAAPAGHVM